MNDDPTVIRQWRTLRMLGARRHGIVSPLQGQSDRSGRSHSVRVSEARGLRYLKQRVEQSIKAYHGHTVKT